MSELLISVRNAAEARLVAETRAARIIDIKEPRQGALGRTSTRVLQDILATVDENAWLSVALGELKDLCMQALPGNHEFLSRFQFAKIGLAHLADDPDWRRLLKVQFSRLPESVGRVAVAYFDHRSCRAPSIEEVVMTGKSIRCHAILLDTCEKTKGNLFEFVSESDLKKVLNLIRELDMKSVVAGSVSVGCLEKVLLCNPDLIGVRGAVCNRVRTEGIDGNKLLEFVNLFRDFSTSISEN